MCCLPRREARDGGVLLGYDATRTHQLRSATKSVVSALAGIAIDRGALTGVGKRVLPQMHCASYAHPDSRKTVITLRNFLSMSIAEMMRTRISAYRKSLLETNAVSEPKGEANIRCSSQISLTRRGTHRRIESVTRSRFV